MADKLNRISEMLPGAGYLCCFGEVLWDLLPEGKVIGGAPFNVAAHLSHLGVPAFFISRVGNDEPGNEIRRWVESRNILSEWIETDRDYATGTVRVQLDDKQQAAYDIVSPVAWDFISVNDEMISVVKRSRGIIFGSLACRQAVTRHSLLALLDAAPLKIFDVNLRPPHYSQPLIESLLHRADLVKLNDDELNIIAAWHPASGYSEDDRMRFLQKKFSLQTVIVTRGGDGAVLLHDQIYRVPGFKVTVADTVGSGDAFLAGFLKKHINGEAPADALTYASALGALVATHRGANPTISEAEILKLMRENNND
jgi:fructokinase